MSWIVLTGYFLISYTIHSLLFRALVVKRSPPPPFTHPHMCHCVNSHGNGWFHCGETVCSHIAYTNTLIQKSHQSVFIKG